MASSFCLYGAHLKQGKGWVKSLSDEEREVTLRSTKSRIRGEARCSRCSVQGSRLFIAAHYYRHCQPPGAGPGVSGAETRHPMCSHHR